MAPKALRIELVGMPRVLFPNGDTHTLERRDAALLAWLVLQGPTPRRRLVSLLWPDVPTRVAQTNLRQRLFRLKQRVGSEIVVSAPVIQLAAGICNDLGADAPESDPLKPESARPLLGSHAYDDCGELGEWVTLARERWQLTRHNRLAQRAADLESEGRIAEALAFAELLIAEAPTAEHAHRRIMRLHYRRGDRAAALAAFARCHEALARELQTSPGEETRALLSLIERSDTLPPPVAAPAAVATLRPPRLIGRAKEWRAIEGAWQSGHSVLLSGEAGIGKSRLALDFASAQGQPFLHRAHPGDDRIAYSLLARMLRGLIDKFGSAPPGWVTEELARLLPEVGSCPPGRLEPLRLHQAVAEALTVWETGGLNLLAIDDLHFADEASLGWWLAWLPNRVRVQALMTVRPDEKPRALDTLDDIDVVEIPLLPLGVVDVEALLDSLMIPGLDAAELAAPLTTHSGGNPLFILETLKAASAESLATLRSSGMALRSSATISKLLERRLSQLSPQALRLARMAALAGTDFSAELASRVLGVHVLDVTDAFGELERRQVIVDERFAHDLMWEAALRSVTEPVARALHREIARALEDSHRPAARIAHHWEAAQDWARAAPQLGLAAKRARRAAHSAEALTWWDRCAASYARAGEHASRFEALCQSVDTAFAVESSVLLAERIERLFTLCQTDAERLRALLFRVRQLGIDHRFEEAMPFSIEGLNLARTLGDRVTEIRFIGLRGVGMALDGQHSQGLALLESAARAVEGIDDDETRSEFSGDFAYVLHSNGRFNEAAQWYERASHLAQVLGENDTAATLLSNLATCQGLMGQYEAALATALRAHGLHTRGGQIEGDAYILSLMNVGMLYAATGQIGESLSSYLRALELSRRGSSTNITLTLEHHVANTYLTLGQPARARQVLSPLTPDAANVAFLRRATIEWRIASARAPQGPEKLQQTLDQFGAQTTVINRMALELSIAAALPAEQSLARSERLLVQAREGGQSAVALTALIRLADAQRRCGQLAHAAASAREAVAKAQTEGWHDMSSAQFWWLAFQALDAGGWRDDALHALRTGALWSKNVAAGLPEELRNSFLHRGPVVPFLMAAAQRLLPP